MSDITKICVICGDIAIARNFGAYSCKSCKPFFRRNANKVFICKNEGNCLINRITRKKCRKCRLDKCFAVGMKKEMILNDVEKHFRRSMVEVNRKLKKEGVKQVWLTPVITKIDKSEVNLFCESSSSTNSSENSIDEENEIKLDTNSFICSETSVFDESSSHSYKTNQELVPKYFTISEPVINYDKNFTEAENYTLSELFQVFKPVANCLNKNCILFDIKDISEMVKTGNYFYEREINNFVNAIKKMSIFKDESVCDNDRIAMVKYSCMDILCLRAIQIYDSNKDSWIVSVDNDHGLSMSLSLFKTLKHDIYMTYKNHLIDIIKECDSDTIILDLLSAIALFNPNRPNIINRDNIRAQQQIYLNLIQRYLYFKYRNKYESDIKFEKLLNTLTNAHILGNLEKKYLFGDYPEQYGPLIKEVLDLHEL